MKEPEKCTVEYVGFQKPETADEVVLEILGLELAIKQAEHRVAFLRQSLKLTEMKMKDTPKSPPETK